ncbi:hypothetical protein A9R05_35440 (plasmid) [Burkholderia sp. KK1]|nr:hypothetical protein A9R05_35440 [Burkholderia sp. KK1]
MTTHRIVANHGVHHCVQRVREQNLRACTGERSRGIDFAIQNGRQAREHDIAHDTAANRSHDAEQNGEFRAMPEAQGLLRARYGE